MSACLPVFWIEPRLDYRLILAPVLPLDTEMPAEATSAMNDQYEKVMRDSFLTNLKTINEINKCKMEVTREFWQQMHDSKACTCNRCGASSRGTADPHDYRRVVLLLPEFPIITNVRSWWCEGCQVRNILKLIESFLFYIIL